MSFLHFSEIAGWFATGAALGVVYLWLLGRSVAAIEPPTAKLAAAAYLGLRVALAAGAFWIAAKHGAVPLLSSFLGFLAVRTAALWRMTEAGSGH